ncbi:MAG: hypothetical protein RL698_3088 [Pseudomonadota bacterium]
MRRACDRPNPSRRAAKRVVTGCNRRRPLLRPTSTGGPRRPEFCAHKKLGIAANNSNGMVRPIRYFEVMVPTP